MLFKNTINYKRTNINISVTRLLRLILFIKKLYCRRISIKPSLHIFESYSNWKHILMHEKNYQQLFHSFFIFVAVRNKPFSTITLKHIYFVLNLSGPYFITNANFLIAYIHLFSVLRWSGTNHSISGLFTIFLILTFRVLPSTILYKLKERN